MRTRFTNGCQWGICSRYRLLSSISWLTQYYHLVKGVFKFGAFALTPFEPTPLVFMSQHSLVIGGSGYVGLELCRQLKSTGQRVTMLNRRSFPHDLGIDSIQA